MHIEKKLSGFAEEEKAQKTSVTPSVLAQLSDFIFDSR